MSKKISRYQRIQRERRFMRVTLSPDALMDWFIVQAHIGDTRPLHIIRGLPSDAILYGVYTSPDTYGISFVVGHQSFDQVPNGGVIPNHPDIIVMNPPVAAPSPGTNGGESGGAA
jgi:hypothetical protein